MSYSTRAAALLVAVAAATFATIAPSARAQDTAISKGDVKVPDRINADELRMQMRKLWVSNAIWMREYIVNTIEADFSLDAATKRLAKNQDDIGRALVPYYGTETGTKLTTLLKQHSTLVGEMIGAVRAKDQTKLHAAENRWTTNANDLATLLSGANPNWPMTTLYPMISESLNLTSEETKARLERKFDLDVETFDKILAQSLKVADAFSDGIIKQFPNK